MALGVESPRPRCYPPTGSTRPWLRRRYVSPNWAPPSPRAPPTGAFKMWTGSSSDASSRRGRCLPWCHLPVLDFHRSRGAVDGNHSSAARCLCPRPILGSGPQQSNLRRHRARNVGADVLRLDLVLPQPGGQSARVERSGNDIVRWTNAGKPPRNTPTVHFASERGDGPRRVCARIGRPVRGVIESQSASAWTDGRWADTAKCAQPSSYVARLLACPSITVGMTSGHSDCRREAGRPSPPVT